MLLYGHTALRAPPWTFTLHRVCSHHPRNVSAHALSSPCHLEGSASSHTGPAVRPEGRRATHASDPPPPHPLATHGVHGVPTRHGPKPAVVLLTSTSTQYNHRTASGIPAGSPSPSTMYIHSVQSSQQPIRLRAGGWATNERLLRPHLGDRGAPTPRGAGADRARPPGSLPHSVTLSVAARAPRTAFRSGHDS